MNIAQVARRFVRSHWGGTETVILETCKHMLRLGHRTEVLCPNALATTNGESIDGVRVLLTMGRIDPQKNQHFVVDAFPQLLRLVPDAHLVFIGHVTNEPYCEELRRRIGELDQPQRVTVITGLDAGSTDLVDAYHAADVFVLPSLHEPFGIVILEAWAAGRPVVASRVGGVASLVADSEDGLLFDAHDQQGFLRACTAILDRPEYRRQLADRGQRKARQQYGWDTITRRLLEIYEEVVRESHLRQ